jgi:hypothetical protein
MKEKQETPDSPGWADLRAYINATPELISLLYDLDLLPEQLDKPSHDFNRMLLLSAWHRVKFTDWHPLSHPAKEGAK